MCIGFQASPYQNHTYLIFFNSLGARFPIGGDFNVKHLLWISRVTNSWGHTLLSTLSSENCSTISPNSPTYWPTDPNSFPDLIDFFISDGLKTYFKREFSVTNFWFIWLESLSDPLSRIHQPQNPSYKTPEKLNLAVHNFTIIIQQCAWKSSPKKGESVPTPAHSLTQILKAERSSLRPSFLQSVTLARKTTNSSPIWIL